VSGEGIYVYNVTDERLGGVLQVTASHEMLHAAYERLNESDKIRVDGLITEAFKTVADERIKSTIEDYRKNGADTTNELHSILGTEVRTLPPELETYYKRYFTDRQVVVGYSERYEQAFTERKNKVAESDTQLGQLKKQIDTAEATLDAKSKAIETERSRLSGLLSAKSYSAYNAGVPGYNAQVSDYNQQVRSVRGMIDQYNKLVAERNAIVLEEGELVKAIDSRPNTIDSQ
jgi:predicted  nucleic acid-binding Zn-ribbon protein